MVAMIMVMRKFSNLPFRDSKGYSPYLIPVGGSNYLGMIGYLEVFNEMIEQVL